MSGFISTFTIDSDGTITGLRTANGFVRDYIYHNHGATSHIVQYKLVKVDSKQITSCVYFEVWIEQI